VVATLPGIESVPVMFQGLIPPPGAQAIRFRYLVQSRFQSLLWQGPFVEQCRRIGMNLGTLIDETDHSDLAEGFYIKVEIDGQVVERYKVVRLEFLQIILQNESHWKTRRAFPNISRAT